MLEFGFLITTLLFFLFFYRATGGNKRVLFASIFWLILIASFSLTGFFQNTNTVPPRFIIVLIGNLIFILFIFKTIKSQKFNFSYVLLIHTLRIPVEIVLYLLFLGKQVPKIMTFEGYNFDILIGISAFTLFLLIQFFKVNIPKRVLIAWNIFGLLFLLNIVIIAILSAPLSIQQFSFEQPNIAVLSFPYVFLPSFIVPLVILTHIISLKQLNQR